jgi:RND family efflux transporter MFP subunit
VDEANARLQERLMTALDLMLSTMSEGKWQSASQAAATELAIRLGCDRVSVGFGDGNGVRFTALSHSADFSKRIDLVRAIEAAMNEAADQGEALWHSPMEALHEGDATSKIRITREHQILAREYGNPLIYSVPFFVSNEAYGVFLFEWASTEIDPVSRHLADVMPSILGRVLLEKREHQLPILQRLRRGFKHFQERLFGPKHGFFKLVTSLLILALIFFSVARGEFTLSAGAELEGGMIRVIASPYDAYVATALVRAGQTVRSGQVLATLDDRDLKLESSRWASQRLQYQKQLQDSEAQHDLAEVQITRSQIQQAAAQLYLVNQQLERATLRAPFDGIVVSGDLSQKLGGALHKGETLFEIAPLDSYRVVLLVNEEDISYVEVGQQGKLMLTALPGEALPFTTTLITPVAEAFEGKNSFRVEANLEGRADKLRPGMAGIGKLTVGQNYLIWIWTRQTTSWLRVLIWKWFGL